MTSTFTCQNSISLCLASSVFQGQICLLLQVFLNFLLLHSSPLSRDITLPTKVRLVKAMVFPVVMYGCESWTVKKAERQRINAFEHSVGEDSRESLGLQRDLTNPF